MIESSYYAKIGKYYEARALKLERSFTWEPKFTRTDSIPFSCLPHHQEEKLLKSERVHSYKIPDTPNGGKKPYDGYTIFDAIPVVVIIYYIPRKTEVYEIHIRDFIDESEFSARKSLTKERASEIGELIYI